MKSSPRTMPRFAWLMMLVACGARSSLGVPTESESAPEPEPEARCGDGILQPGEACDDGNVVDRDGCEADCTLLSCGDGVVDKGEACDSPDRSQCTEICTLPICGDGFVAPFEECDDGRDNGPRLASLLLVVDGDQTPIRPFADFASPTGFYAYSSASAHTSLEQPFGSELFLFAVRRSTGLSLFSIHNIDVDSSGITTGQGQAAQDFFGLPAGTFVELADEQDELEMLDEIQAQGRWQWQNNTDGGILSGLPFPGEWEIDIDSDFKLGIDNLRYVSDDGDIALPLDQTVTLVAHLQGPRCSPECVAYRCGDGFVDAGEACDDGNQSSGDGCAQDCSHFD